MRNHHAPVPTSRRARSALSASLLLLVLALLGCGESPDVGGAPSAAPTYYGDVRPILEAKCTSCHQDGGFAPFSLTSFSNAKTAAGGISQQVVARTMPPWMPAAGCLDYQGQASLTDAQIDTIRRWAEAGAPEGDASTPGRPIPEETSGLSRVDVSLEMRAPFIQTELPDQLRCFVLDWPVDHPTFITGFGAVPGTARVVHHMSVWAASPDQLATLQHEDARDPGAGFDCFSGPAGTDYEIASWVPGVTGYNFAPDTGYPIAPGSKIVVQMHYNAVVSGPAPDRSTLLFKTDDHVAHPSRLFHFRGDTWVKDLDIPALAPDTERSTSIDLGVDHPLKIYWVNLHMHYLGAHATLGITRANGDHECLLDIPAWNFHWQQSYMPVHPPELYPGDRVDLSCHWDNTAAHQPIVNGSPQVPHDTRWGVHSTEEMCIGSLYTTDEAD